MQYGESMMINVTEAPSYFNTACSILAMETSLCPKVFVLLLFLL